MRGSKMYTTVRGYQELTRKSLSSIFGQNNVIKEWNVAKESRDAFTRQLYSPRLDLAVGPFNIDANIKRNQEEIKKALDNRRKFIDAMLQHSDPPACGIEQFLANSNPNPRCFLAVEIENSGSSKHMLGNIANVSILGAIGVVVPFNDEKLALCRRIREYVAFATEVRKLKGVFKNVLIINKQNFLRVLESEPTGRACQPPPAAVPIR